MNERAGGEMGQGSFSKVANWQDHPFNLRLRVAAKSDSKGRAVVERVIWAVPTLYHPQASWSILI